jgi:hypothetical protein
VIADSSSGVFVAGPATTTRIEGNWIGTDSSGTVDLGHEYDGVGLDNAVGNTVGGAGGWIGSWPGVHCNGALITEGAAGHEQGSFGIDGFGRHLLETDRRRVLATDIVSNLRLGHRPSHGRRGRGHGVAPELSTSHRSSRGLDRRRSSANRSTRYVMAVTTPRA